MLGARSCCALCPLVVRSVCTVQTCKNHESIGLLRPCRLITATSRLSQLQSAICQTQNRSGSGASCGQNWDFSVVLDCLEVFEEEIELAQQPTIAGLESELVSSSGIEEGLLRNIHEARPWPFSQHCAQAMCMQHTHRIHLTLADRFAPL